MDARVLLPRRLNGKIESTCPRQYSPLEHRTRKGKRRRRRREETGVFSRLNPLSNDRRSIENFNSCINEFLTFPSFETSLPRYFITGIGILFRKWRGSREKKYIYFMTKIVFYHSTLVKHRVKGLIIVISFLVSFETYRDYRVPRTVLFLSSVVA